LGRATPPALLTGPCSFSFYLFHSLESFLRGKKFAKRANLIERLSDFFDSKPTDFYSAGIKKLPDRWRKAVANKGEYFE
jgi:hypothetical protein